MGILFHRKEKYAVPHCAILIGGKEKFFSSKRNNQINTRYVFMKYGVAQGDQEIEH